MGKRFEVRVVRKRIKDLAVADYNPRGITDEAMGGLSSSIEEFGLVEPLVWNERSGRIVGGHQRLKSLVAAGATEVSVSVVDLDDLREKALNLALNSQAIAGHWEAGLDDLLNELDTEMPDLSDRLLLDALRGLEEEAGASGPENGSTASDDVPAAPDTPSGKPGDVWELGQHLLACGDSTDPELRRLILQDGDADLVFTDPPYGVSLASKQDRPELNQRKDHKEVANDRLSGDELKNLLDTSFSEIRDALKPGGSFYICSPAGAEETVFRLAVQSLFDLRQCIVWCKDRFVFGRQDYHWRHESILYGWKDGAAHHFIDDRTQDTVWEIERPAASKQHPTMKPVELVLKAMTNSSKPGQVVYDPFGGSGTTLVVAEEIGRKARLIELDPRYCDVIVQRWEEQTGNEAVRR